MSHATEIWKIGEAAVVAAADVVAAMSVAREEVEEEERPRPAEKRWLSHLRLADQRVFLDYAKDHNFKARILILRF